MQREFICGDCMNFLPDFPDNYFDVAVVDPPYFSGPEKRGFYGRKISPIGVQRIYKVSEQWNIEDLSVRPDWCPLIDLPEKDNGDYPANTSDAGFAEGWNQCIDEITGGNSDD